MGKGFYSDGRPWPRLSETLTGPKCHGICQRCGVSENVHCWRECDADDQPTPVVLFLCGQCSEKIIGPHPRLYVDGVDLNSPMPGAMACCVTCFYRTNFTCRHSDLKANGGAGLKITMSQPTTIHVDGRTKGGKRFGRWYQRYAKPPTCIGVTPIAKPEEVP